MRLRVPRLLRLIGVLLAVFLLLTVGLLYGVRTAQPIPYCLPYQKQTQAWYMQVDSRNGQPQTVYRNYLTKFDYAVYPNTLSPNGQAFMRLAQSGYAGPDALFAGAPNGEKMIEVANEYYMEGGWSPDGQHFAFVYNSDFNYIAIVDAAGKHKHVQPVSTFERGGFPHFAGWAADGRYLATMTFNDKGAAAYYIIEADTLQPNPTSITAYGEDYRQIGSLVWASQGHRFAYVVYDGKQYELVIASPERGVEQRFVLSEPDEWYLQLPMVWSPDGRYIALHRATSSKREEAIWEYWTYSIFGVDGSKHTGIKGQKNYVSEFEKIPDGWWSVDGSTWYFRQQIPVEGVDQTDVDMLSYVMGYQVATDTAHVLVEHVANSPLVFDGEDRFAIPVWSKDTLKDTLDIVLVSAADNTRSTLVTGAALEPKPRLAWSASNGGTVAAIWYRRTATGQQTAALTWAHTDGTAPQTIDQNFDDIIELYWLNDHRSLMYLAHRGDALIVGIVDLETGASTQLDDSIRDDEDKPADSWSQIRRLFASPSGKQLIVKMGRWDQQTLYVISLADQRIMKWQLEPSALGDPAWRSDETIFAVIQYGNAQTGQDTLYIAATDGEVLREAKLAPNEDYYRSNNLLAWNWCR